ncbi:MULTISPECIES: hypothetical protein [unclassified Lentimonas]|uniref:hypothetical protein n=1 Tax=unclassified Lentimonas TaxID=2630993 RepID=UPI00138943A6|nr:MULTISPECIES: hypothetical protein [unclassified Lentimonas]
MISTLKNDMRVLAQEFYDYELTAGEYPTTQNTAGLFPAGMEDSMPRAWILPSVVGGTYRWINSNATATDAYAYIEITGSSSYPLRISTEQLAGIDEDLDDGNLSTGRFQLHGLSIRYYLK